VAFHFLYMLAAILCKAIQESRTILRRQLCSRKVKIIYRVHGQDGQPFHQT